MLEVRL